MDRGDRRGGGAIAALILLVDAFREVFAVIQV